MKYTDEQWQQMFNQVDESNLSSEQWCLQNNISFGSYRYHRYSKNKSNDTSRVQENHKLVKVKIADNDISTHANLDGFDIVIGKASIKVGSVDDLDAVARLINLINEA